MRKRDTKLLLLPGVLSGLALMWLLAGCSTEECLENQTSLPLAGFYSSSLQPKQISIDSLTIYGIGAPHDSLLVNVGRSLKSSYLPFRIDEGDTRFVFQYDAPSLAKWELRDTVGFSYETVPYFVSAACGAIYKYEIKEITTTHWLIDSVACPKGVIDNEDMENIIIYFRTSEK